MLLNLVTIAALSSSALAAPWGVYGSGGGQPSSGSSGQVPFKFPLPNGFPNISVPSTTLTAIELQAHGTLPNGPLPTTLTVSLKRNAFHSGKSLLSRKLTRGRT